MMSWPMMCMQFKFYLIYTFIICHHVLLYSQNGKSRYVWCLIFLLDSFTCSYIHRWYSYTIIRACMDTTSIIMLYLLTTITFEIKDIPIYRLIVYFSLHEFGLCIHYNKLYMISSSYKIHIPGYLQWMKEASSLFMVSIYVFCMQNTSTLYRIF